MNINCSFSIVFANVRSTRRKTWDETLFNLFWLINSLVEIFV